MTENWAARVTDPTLIIAVLVALAVFATFYTLVMPMLERGDLNKRMRAAPANARGSIRTRRARPPFAPTTTSLSASLSNGSTCARRWLTTRPWTSSRQPAFARKMR